MDVFNLSDDAKAVSDAVDGFVGRINELRAKAKEVTSALIAETNAELAKAETAVKEAVDKLEGVRQSVVVAVPQVQQQPLGVDPNPGNQPQ